MLERAALIIIDEVAMAPAMIFKILDKVLRRIYEAEEEFHPMFAGKVVLFGGDMRQLGPIPNDGQTMGQVHFRNSPAFEAAEVYSLDINMRTDADQLEFSKELRDVGEGTTKEHYAFPKGSVALRKDMVIQDSQLKTLIEWTFGDDPSVSGAACAILTPFNRDCFKVNKMIVDEMPGEVYRALSEDSVVDDCTTNKLMEDGSQPVTEVDGEVSRRLVHQDELNMILETGMPPHVLELKKGVIVNLIKNLDVSAGLVNGTRLRVVSISRDLLVCDIISDFPNIAEKRVSLPRVRFLKECSHALVMQRVQFPVRVAFACTINKSQGLTLDKVRLLIFHLCFNIFVSSFFLS